MNDIHVQQTSQIFIFMKLADKICVPKTSGENMYTQVQPPAIITFTGHKFNGKLMMEQNWVLEYLFSNCQA